MLIFVRLKCCTKSHCLFVNFFILVMRGEINLYFFAANGIKLRISFD